MDKSEDNDSSLHLTMPAPEVVGLLADIPGGETNLLPETLTHADLKVWFTVPLNSAPYVDEEKVELFVDGSPNPLVTRTWNTSIGESDRYLEIPQAWLRNNDGEHRFNYRATIFNGESEDSFELVMTLDTRAPVLAADSQLVFPPEVSLPNNQVTDRYLQANGDELKASLPTYTTPRPWDRIEWFWDTTQGNAISGGFIELNDQNYADPVVVTIAGQLIRTRGDGRRFVRYRVQDRAGNTSLDSAYVELDVAATPIPRTLPPAQVKNATGGTSSGTLNPTIDATGATVTVPANAVIYDGEPVFVQWGEEGSAGGYRTDIPTSAGTREYKVPIDKVAFHIGKPLPVRYEVFETGTVEPYKSQLYTLQVATLSGLPTVQCDAVSGSRLSLGNIPAGGYANFTLGSWALMATYQFITIKVIGVDSNLNTVEIPVLTESAVPQVAPTISVGRISKTDLQRFKLNESLEVWVRVSFDGKQTWQRFPSLTPTLVA